MLRDDVSATCLSCLCAYLSVCLSGRPWSVVHWQMTDVIMPPGGHCVVMTTTWPASQPAAGCVACIAYNYITHSMMLFACRRPFIFRQQFHCLFFASHGQTNSFHAECRTTLWTSLTRVFSLIPVILKLMKELKVISLAIMPCCIVCNALLAIVKPSVHRTRDL